MASGRCHAQSFHMKIWMGNLLLSVVALGCLAGCANHGGAGSAPGVQTGRAQSQQGEFYKTETLTPGVGSALFPDPGWR
jgi:hypothetical protein